MFAFRGGDVEQAFADADHVLDDTLRLHRHTATPLEPRAALAHYDDRAERLTLWVSTQAPHPLRTTLADTLQMDENDIPCDSTPGRWSIWGENSDLSGRPSGLPLVETNRQAG